MYEAKQYCHFLAGFFIPNRGLLAGIWHQGRSQDLLSLFIWKTLFQKCKNFYKKVFYFYFFGLNNHVFSQQAIFWDMTEV